jgi:hypothetical protein
MYVKTKVRELGFKSWHSVSAFCHLPSATWHLHRARCYSLTMSNMWSTWEGPRYIERYPPSMVVIMILYF